MLCLAPLCPNEVTAWWKLFARHLLLLFLRDIKTVGKTWWYFFIVKVALGLLSIELFLFLIATVPPSSAWDNLSDRWIVVSFANVEAEYLGRWFWFYTIILLVEHFVEFNQKLLINAVQKVRHPDQLLVQNHSISSWDWNTKVLEQFDYLLVRTFHLLFEQDQD